MHKLVSFLAIIVLLACQSPGSNASNSLHDTAPWQVIEESDVTVEELLARHVQALGGEEALARIESVRKTGTFTGPDFADVPIVTAIRTPDGYLRKVEAGPGETSILGFDGETAWELAPTVGVEEPTPLPEREVVAFRRDTDLAGPLVDPEEKGHQVELLGKTKNGYKLEVTFDGGDERHYLLHPETFLISRYLETRILRGQLTTEAEGRYLDYREVGGVKWAFFESLAMPAVDFRQSITWEEIEVGVELEDALFAMPE